MELRCMPLDCGFNLQSLYYGILQADARPFESRNNPAEVSPKRQSLLSSENDAGHS
jgi:hypothetical protein